MTKERGGGREGESIFKTKDRLGDNEWCKPDDLLESAPRSHSHTWPLFFLFFLFSPLLLFLICLFLYPALSAF